MRWFLVSLFYSYIAVSRGQYAGDEADDDSDDNCLPRLANDCFKFVSDNLNCHLNPNVSMACEKKDASDLCSAINGGIQCARDIIDGDCTSEDGRDNFDLWMNGIANMYRTVCSNNMQLLKVIIESSHCWNSGKFIACLEEEKNILHIVDFLKMKQDLHNCFRIIINIASCSTRASMQIASCTSPHNAINELLQTFFSAGICAGVHNGQHYKTPIPQFSIYLISTFIISGFTSSIF